jgi:hypothetical protein
LSIGAYLEEQSSLAERATALEVAVLQRSNLMRHDAAEAADLLYLAFVHYLTLVRERAVRNRLSHLAELSHRNVEVQPLLE